MIQPFVQELHQRLVLAPWWPSQESDWTEIWSASYIVLLPIYIFEVRSSRNLVYTYNLKLCTYVPLGHMTYQTKFRSDLILGLATTGPKLKTQKVL
jgi:hypothetical protein